MKGKKVRVGTYFDPHHWEGCFAVTCAGKCPYKAECFGSEGRHVKETEEFIYAINKKLKPVGLMQKIAYAFKKPSETDARSNLSRLEIIELDHTIAQHGTRFNDKQGIYYKDPNAERDVLNTGVNSWIFR